MYNEINTAEKVHKHLKSDKKVLQRAKKFGCENSNMTFSNTMITSKSRSKFYLGMIGHTSRLLFISLDSRDSAKGTRPHYNFSLSSAEILALRLINEIAF